MGSHGNDRSKKFQIKKSPDKIHRIGLKFSVLDSRTNLRFVCYLSSPDFPLVCYRASSFSAIQVMDLSPLTVLKQGNISRLYNASFVSFFSRCDGPITAHGFKTGKDIQTL
ncbi:hypothetical protein K1719_024750 [Acacia pycnantha]|nr:hypothetical protein K1719_024750 [Acacia pycnantha]